MTITLQIVAYSAALTWISFLMGSTFRNRMWTAEGRKAGIGSRDQAPQATLMGGRADRAAANSIESFITFAALALTAHVAGLDNDHVALGAKIYFIARVAYLPAYYFGLNPWRTIIWFVSVVGQGMILVAILSA